MRVKLLCLLSLFAMLQRTASATSYTYTYTGNNYTNADSPFATTESVTGSFTVATALGANFNGLITPSSFSFADGLQTMTQGSSIASDYFDVQTDATGAVSWWEIYITTNSDAIETYSSYYDQGVYTYVASCWGCSYDVAAFAYNNYDPGSWTSNAPVIVPPSAAPEPSSLALMGTGLLGLFGAAKLSRRFNSPAL